MTEPPPQVTTILSWILVPTGPGLNKFLAMSVVSTLCGSTFQPIKSFPVFSLTGVWLQWTSRCWGRGGTVGMFSNPASHHSVIKFSHWVSCYFRSTFLISAQPCCQSHHVISTLIVISHWGKQSMRHSSIVMRHYKHHSLLRICPRILRIQLRDLDVIWYNCWNVCICSKQLCSFAWEPPNI